MSIDEKAFAEANREMRNIPSASLREFVEAYEAAKASEQPVHSTSEFERFEKWFTLTYIDMCVGTQGAYRNFDAYHYALKGWSAAIDTKRESVPQPIAELLNAVHNANPTDLKLWFVRPGMGRNFSEAIDAIRALYKIEDQEGK